MCCYGTIYIYRTGEPSSDPDDVDYAPSVTANARRSRLEKRTAQKQREESGKQKAEEEKQELEIREQETVQGLLAMNALSSVATQTEENES